ncbi:MAG TPA: Ig-like domain-containing protein [Longimicrobiaceae bacterium]|nr:Ig-like domain-containing protein [Longimicrobiaceae bacterium]
MSSRKAATRATFLLLLAACTGDSGSLLAPEPGGPTLEVSDAAHSGTVPGFYFLPPMVQQPSYTGTFDPALSPQVEVCELSGTSCGTVIATYTTTTGPGGEVVRVDPGGEKYSINWHTDLFSLDVTRHYRISVFVGSFRLGFADVDPVSTGKELKLVDTGEYIALVDGRTLPVKFRIETGIVASVTVAPSSAEIGVGETQQFTATLTDLHGNPVAAAVAWSSSDPAVATVDGSGLATGVAEGTVTVTASSGGASGSASLTVRNPNTAPTAADDAFEAIGNVSVPVAAPGVLANDTDGENNALSVAAPGTYPTANGGTVTLNADGSFTYLSAPGFTGTDQFTYAASDGSLDSNTATVTIGVGSRVWYVRNDGTSPGDGRDASPFATLKAAESASSAGETIFLLAGNGSTTGYDEGIVLKAGQALTGQGVASTITAVLNGQSVVLLAAGSAPQVTRSTAGATVQLATDNTVQGVAVASTAGAGIAGSGFGTLTAGSVSVSAVGGPALDLQNGTVAATFSSLSSASSAGAGVRLAAVGGSLAASGGTVAGAAGSGVDVAGGAANLTLTLSGMTVTGSGARGIALTGSGGGTVTASVAQSTISGNGTSGVFTGFTGASGFDLTVADNAILNNNIGIDIATGFAASRFALTGNTLTGHRSNAVNVVGDASVPAGAKVNGTISGNVIGSGAAGSGSLTALGIAIDMRGGETAAIVVSNNQVRNTALQGIFADSRIDGGMLHLTVGNNTVAAPEDAFSVVDGVRVVSRNARTTCLDLSGNTSAGANGGSGYSVRQANTAVFQLQGFAGTGTSAASVATFIEGNNTGTAAVQTSGTGTVVNYTGGTCLTTIP